MNPMTNVKNITKLNEIELASGLIHKKSWHDMYKDSAWIFIGGLPYDLTEGDLLAVFSQYGEIVNINLVRDKKSGKSKGFCFLCYSNQKSTVLAVDNFNGIKLCNRTIRVDHVANYKPPKENEGDDEVTKTLKSEGCAPDVMQSHFTDNAQLQTKKKKPKKEKKKKRKHSSDAADSDRDTASVEIKEEKYDPGYDKYDASSSRNDTNKIKRETSLERSKGKSSQMHDKFRSKVDNSRTWGSDRLRYEDENGLLTNIKQEKEYSQRKKNSEASFKSKSSSKSHKRARSHSADDTSRNHADIINHRHEKDRTKSKHSESKRRYKDTVDSSTSSSDDDSSTESSSDNERKYSKKDKYRTRDEKKSYQEERRHKHYQQREDFNHAPSKNRHYDESEKYSDHRSKVKHREDDSDDSNRRNSDYHHHKRKHSKR